MIGIFAAGRNGSTLLMRLLDGSPDLWVHPVEVNYLSVFSDLARFGTVRGETIFNAVTERPLWLDRPVALELLERRFAGHVEQLRDLYTANLVAPATVAGDAFAALRGQPACDARTFLPAFLAGARAVVQGGAAVGPEPRYVFKSIETAYLREYAEVFPEMRFIHLVRDPVDNFATVKRTMLVRRKRPFWYLGGDELRTHLDKRWLPHARWIVEEGRCDPARNLLVRYEDLCDRPTEVIAELCAWLGVAPPADPTRQTVLGGRTMAELPPSSSSGASTRAEVVRNTAAAFGYAPVVSQRERDYIAFRAGPLARALGYPDVADAAPRSRWRLALAWLLPDRRELSYPRLTRRLDFARTGLALLKRRGWIYRSLFFPA